MTIKQRYYRVCRGFATLYGIILISASLVILGFLIEMGNYIYIVLKIEQWSDIASHSVVNAYNRTIKESSNREESIKSANNAYEEIKMLIINDLKGKIKINFLTMTKGKVLDPDNKEKDSFIVEINALYLPVSKLIKFPEILIKRSSQRYSKLDI